MTFRKMALLVVAVLASVVPVACPSTSGGPDTGGGGTGSTGSTTGTAGGIPSFGGNGTGHGGAGTVGPGGSFGMGGHPEPASSGTGAGCDTCATALQAGASNLCPGLSADAYAALAACACANVSGSCLATCKNTLCKSGPAGLMCESCFVTACPNEQASCAVN